MQELLGPAAVPAGGVRAWLRCSQHDKPRPIGGRREACGAWPGFEATRRAEGSQRGRAAAHGHTKQPGPTRQATRRPEIRRRYTQHKQESSPTGRHAVSY